MLWFIPLTGGLTKVTKIDYNEVYELSDEEISERYDELIKVMSFGMGKLFQASGKPIDWFKNALPEP